VLAHKALEARIAALSFERVLAGDHDKGALAALAKRT
jgi:hypothetical protein